VTTRTILLSALVVLAVNGCSGEDDGGDLPPSAPEIRDRSCMLELTPARLRSGDCSDGAMSATLSLVAMPL
jgi:hypothetical protein